MSPSHKSKWQNEIVRSGLGPGPVGVGLVMSISANADGTGVYPSMRAVAEGMGCSRGYVERHCATAVEYGWLTTVAKAIPGHRGTEYRLTFGRAESSGQVLQSEALEVSAKCSNLDGQVLQSGPQVLQSEAASAPTASITMKKHHDLNHERHHDPTAEPPARVRLTPEQEGQAQHDRNVAAQAHFQAAAAKARELIAQAPDFE